MTVFNYGSINVDMVYRVPHLVRPGETLSSRSLQTVLGGKGANQSVALARAGVDVRHIGRLGETDGWARQQMQDAGVDMASVEMVEGPGGHAIIQVDDAGENSIILHGGANLSFDRSTLEKYLAEADEGDWLLIQNECNEVGAAMEIASAAGVSIAFNPAPMTAAVSTLPLERCAVLIVNETEASSLAGSDDIDAAVGILAARFPDTRLVLTLGEKGALMHYQGNTSRQSAAAVEVVDTTGAGDTFVGYFLASIIEGLTDEESLARACSAGALAVTCAGATPSIPVAMAVGAFQQAGNKK